MKHILLALLLTLGSLTTWAQQKKDVIVKRNGEKIEGYVKQLNQSEIFYGQENMPATVFRSVAIADVAVILYGDGKVQTFEQPTSPPAAAPDAAAQQPAQAAPPSGTPPGIDPVYGRPIAPAPGTQEQAGYPPAAYGQQPPVQGYGQAQQAPLALTTAQLYQRGYGDAETYYTGYNGARAGTLLTTALASPIWGLIPAIACSASPPKSYRLNIPVGPYSQDPSYAQGYKEAARKKKSRKTWGGYGIGSAIWVGLIIIFSSGR